MNIISKLTGQFPQEDYPKESRIHPLLCQPSGRGRWFIKREDELGFFTSGGKIRKWRTLIPSLVQKKIDAAFLIGSAQSNNILGLSLLLLEKGIRPVPLLLSTHDLNPKGNRLFIELTCGRENIVFVERGSWHRVDETAALMASEWASKGYRTAVIPEGSYTPDAFYGAMTLASDILRNENESGCSFRHIFIEAGTGLQAIALIIALAIACHPASVSVLLLKDSEAEFQKKLEEWRLFLMERFALEVDRSRLHYSLFSPAVQKSFKPLSGSGMDHLIGFAKMTGVWTDPVYSGRLIMEAFSQAEREEMDGDLLLIHSGGLSSLFGFEKALQRRLSSV